MLMKVTSNQILIQSVAWQMQRQGLLYESAVFNEAWTALHEEAMNWHEAAMR
jgi:hypothetical protein